MLLWMSVTVNALSFCTFKPWEDFFRMFLVLLLGLSKVPEAGLYLKGTTEYSLYLLEHKTRFYPQSAWGKTLSFYAYKDT